MIPVLLALLQAGASPAALPTDPGHADVFEVVPVADGVWAALVLPEPAAYAFANSLLVEGEDGWLVVDTQQSTAAARALVGWIRERTDRPVRWVVNTHWHGDHVYGNEAYREAFPDVTIVGHQATREAMAEEGAANRRDELAELPAAIEERRRWLETGVGPGGEELGPGDRAAVQRSLALREAYLEDLSRLSLVPPEVTLTDGLTVHLGDRRVELLHPGRAHTAGDVVVHLPDDGVLAVGDLLEEGPPWLEGAWIPGWAEALGRLRELVAGHGERVRILPAHGGLQADASLLEWQAAFMAALVETARRARSEGWSAAEAAARMDVAPFRDGFASVGLEGEALEDYLTGAMEEALADPSSSG